MELIATSDQQLRHLGYHDPDLALYFAGVFPSDRLPARPIEEGPRGYIVNRRHARSTGQSLGRFVDARRRVYGHGQLCHSVSHVQTAPSLGLVAASFRGVREQWSRDTGRGQSSVRSLRPDVFDTHERRRHLGHVHEPFLVVTIL